MKSYLPKNIAGCIVKLALSTLDCAVPPRKRLLPQVLATLPDLIEIDPVSHFKVCASVLSISVYCVIGSQLGTNIKTSVSPTERYNAYRQRIRSSAERYNAYRARRTARRCAEAHQPLHLLWLKGLEWVKNSYNLLYEHHGSVPPDHLLAAGLRSFASAAMAGQGSSPPQCHVCPQYGTRSEGQWFAKAHKTNLCWCWECTWCR